MLASRQGLPTRGGKAKEKFDSVSVKVKVAGFNRKFVTLEHQIFDGISQLLGKGTQTLVFVSSQSYKPLDIPDEVHAGFLPFT